MSIALLIATCGGTGFAIRLLSKWPRLVFATTSIGSAVLFVLLATAPSTPTSFMGRSLMLGFAERAFLWPAVGVAAALAFFGPLTFEWVEETPARLISNAQGAFFFWSLAPLIVAMSIDSFPLAAFFWAIGLILLVLVAQPRHEGRAGGAAQFLLLTVIATASLLLSNRFFDLYPLTPENLNLVRSAFLFLAWGLGLLLAVVPLHIWMGPLADEMPLLGMAFLVGVAQPVGLLLLLQLMSRMLWLTEKSGLLNAMLLAGAVTIPVGALFAIAESRKGRLLAYLSLVSLGQALIGFGLGTQVGLAAAMLAVLNRAVGIALVAGGMVFVSYHEERRWQAVGALAILAGGLAIAGIPPAVGVASRWGIYVTVASVHPLLVGLLFVSSAAVVLAIVRFVQPVLNNLSAAVESTGEIKVVPYLCAAVIVILLAIVVITGIFPRLLADPLIAALGSADYLK